MMRQVASRFFCFLLLMGLVAGSYGVGRLLRNTAAAPCAWAADEAKAVSLVARAERQMEGTAEKGAVYLNDQLLFSIDTVAGGLTGYERSIIVAKRLNDALAVGAVPEQFVASVAQGQNVVLWKDRPLITVDDAQARAIGKPRQQVAEEWAAFIRSTMRQLLGLPEPSQTQSTALRGEQPAQRSTETPAEAESAAQTTATTEETDWQPPEPYDDKDVPIISVGEGQQIGVARVKGPSSHVRLVQAVAAVETHYEKDLEIEIYVPISTKVPGKTLERIQGVGVIGIAKYRL